MSDYQDIGGGCSISFTSNGQETIGCFLKHPPGPNATATEREAGFCVLHVVFDVPSTAELGRARPLRRVDSWEPLSLSPSIFCSCGAHGFIRDGRWVPA